MRSLPRVLLQLLIGMLLAACVSDTSPVITETPSIIATLSSPTSAATRPTNTPSQMSPTEVPLPRTIAESPQDQAYLRFVHAAPEIGSLNFDVSGLTFADGLRYSRFTQATPLVAGDYNMRVFQRDESDEPSLLLTSVVNLRPGQTLILTVSGSLEDPVLTVIEEVRMPLPTGQGSARLFNGLTGDATDIVISTDTGQLSETVAHLSMSEPIVLDSGSVTFTLQDQTGNEKSFTQSVRALRRHTLALTGRSDDLSTWSLIAFDTRVPGEAMLRVIHAAPEVAEVDVYLGGELLATGLTIYAASNVQMVAGRSQVINIYPTGVLPGQEEPIATDQININPDENRAVILTGTGDSLHFLNILQDTSSLAENESRILFVNVAPGVPRVQYGIPRLEVVVPPLDFGRSSQVFELSTGVYDFVFSGYDESGTFLGDIETAEDIELRAGRRYLYLIAGNESDVSPVVYSDEVGFPSADSQVIGADRIPQEERDTIGIARMRFVNAVEGGSDIDIVVNDADIVADAVSFGEDSRFILLTEGEHTIELRDTETGDELYSELFTFVADVDYSIYAHGLLGDSNFTMLQVEDTAMILSPLNATLRLTNLSGDYYNAFGLGFLASVGGEVAQPFEREDGSIGRPSLFAEINRIIQSVDGGEVSSTVAVVPSVLEFYAIDPLENTLALGLGPVVLEAGKVYDIVIYQYNDSLLMNGFVIEYPAHDAP